MPFKVVSDRATYVSILYLPRFFGRNHFNTVCDKRQSFCLTFCIHNKEKGKVTKKKKKICSCDNNSSLEDPWRIAEKNNSAGHMKLFGLDFS